MGDFANDLALARHHDAQDAEERHADRVFAAKESIEFTRKASLRQRLVKPGSDVVALLGDELLGDEWLNGIEALVRRASNPLPLLTGDRLRIAEEFERLVNGMVSRVVATDLDAAAEEYVRTGQDVDCDEVAA